MLFLFYTPSGTRTLDTLIRLVGLPCLFLAYIAVATLAVPDLKGVPVRDAPFKFDRGDSLRPPSSATGSGWRRELATSLSSVGKST